MKQYLCIFILIIHFYPKVIAQDYIRSPLDSVVTLNFNTLKNRLTNCKNDTICVNFYTNAFIQKAKKNNDTLKWLEGYELKLYGQDKINYSDSIIQLLGTTNNEKFNYELSAVYYTKGLYFYNKRKHNLALTALLKSKELYDDGEADFSIAVVKSRFGFYEEALKTYKSFEKRYLKDNTLLLYSDYLVALFNIGDTYRHLKKLDSASYYNNFGYKKSLSNNNEFTPYFVLNQAATDYNKELYSQSWDSLQKIIPAFQENGDVSNLAMCYYFLGVNAHKLNKTDETVRYLTKVDSISRIVNDLEPEFRKGYEILINHFHSKKDLENELTYIKRLLEIDSVLNQKYVLLSKRLTKEYNTPLLLKEKERIISELNKKHQHYRIYIFIGVLLIFLFATYTVVILNRNKKYKTKLKQLLENDVFTSENENTVPKKNSINISGEVIDDILYKLKNYEQKQEFLQADASVQLLATQFNTNARYLSKIINHYKSKNFSNYINDLRIAYCVKRLKTDTKFKNYTIKAIAEESGFNTAESFNTAFFKSTGVKASFFIKNIDKISRNS